MSVTSVSFHSSNLSSFSFLFLFSAFSFSSVFAGLPEIKSILPRSLKSILSFPQLPSSSPSSEPFRRSVPPGVFRNSEEDFPSDPGPSSRKRKSPEPFDFSSSWSFCGGFDDFVGSPAPSANTSPPIGGSVEEDLVSAFDDLEASCSSVLFSGQPFTFKSFDMLRLRRGRFLIQANIRLNNPATNPSLFQAYILILNLMYEKTNFKHQFLGIKKKPDFDLRVASCGFREGALLRFCSRKDCFVKTEA